MSQAPAVGFISLGCPKALVDSERIITELKSNGYQVVGDYQGADVVIVNTCGFIDAAKAESLETIQEALNENGKVIVTGCLGAQAETITDRFPQVLSVTGPQAYEAVVSAVQTHFPYKSSHDPFIDLVPPQGIKLTPRHYAYLKISEGCNHTCSFCIIPSMRGKLVSRPIGNVMDEAERLVKAGVKELLVISQDTSAYGLDLKYKMDFWQGQPLKTRFYDLCAALAEFGIWVRLHYVYPYPHVDDVIPLMAEDKILPYLDIPFQHASQPILKAMRRPAHAEKVLDRIVKWRQVCPDITLRSTFIVGFPGETDADFECLLDFLREAQLDRVGCFEYSPVEGAAANQLADHVPDDLKAERQERFMEVQAQISAEKMSQKIGKTMQVLIDEVDEAGIIARSKADAPEIDGQVWIEDPSENPSPQRGEARRGAADLKPGQLVQVKITHADTHDLWAEVVN
jgi:ribosomal protein S12 methylthiotransferase